MSAEHHRILDLEGGHNIRDLGGYATMDGNHTKWQTFFRSASLNELTSEAQDSLRKLGLATVVDLRLASEVEEEPSVFAASTEPPIYVHIDILIDGKPRPDPPAELAPEMRIAESYKFWLEERQPGIRAALETFARPGALPGLFNCAAGKDRTGIIAALLLGLAGVPDETIVDDYALSASCLWERDRNAFRAKHGDDVSLEYFQRAYSSPKTMEAVLAYLRERYGGPVEYIATIGVSGNDARVLRSNLRA